MLNKDFGLKLKEYRKKLKLSQVEVSEQAFISRRKLIDIEQGKTNPSIEDLISLSLVFKEDIAKLFFEYKKFKNINLKKEIDEIESKLSDMDYNSLKENLNILEQEKNMNQYIKQYYYAILGFYHMKSNEMNVDLAINYLNKMLKINNKNFSINEYFNFKYSSLELRVLIALADCIRYNGNSELYFNICDFAFNQLSEVNISYFVVSINYSIVLSMKKEYQLSIDIINKCIEIGNNSNIFTYLPILYFLNYLNHKKSNNIIESENCLNRAIFLCDCYNKTNLKKSFLKN